MKRLLKKMGKIFLYIALSLGACICVTIITISIFIRPSNDREWNDDQKVPPYAEMSTNEAGEDLVTIYNIRNISYASTTDYVADYYDKTFNLNELTKVWFMVEPFNTLPGAAHTLLSFEFENDQFVSISVEIRKEKGESFHPVKGIFNQYELMYVIADERDVIKLRSNYRKDKVYLYPIKTTDEKAKRLFLDMITRANQLKEKPEFYNTISSNCTTNIASHVNTITPDKVPFLDLRLLLPENADQLAYELGLIDTDLSFEQAREKYLINDRAEKYADDPEFSVRIRE